MIEIIHVQMRDEGRVVPYNARGIKYEVGDYVVVEADRGIDYGQVASEPEVLDHLETNDPIKAVIRKVDPKDEEKIEVNKKKAREAHKACEKKILEHKLPMKLVDSEYSFDRSKLVFYFTSEGRVDFRNLVKDLASAFKVRIELRQIGVRDEAKMLGGCGHCGRVLCCVSHLKNFEPVTIKMAKDQNLSLNPTKISGVCGRLMCCLNYEHSTYQFMGKQLPSEGERLRVGEETVRVRNVDILKKRLMVEYQDGLVKELSFSGCCCFDGSGQQCEAHADIVSLRKRKGKG